jgi:hypothetical protein
MVSTTMPVVRSRDWREILFRVLAVVCTLLLLVSGGIASLLAPWGSPGSGFPGFTPELHRWHSALLGVFEGILLPGLLVALLRRPRERPLLMQLYVLVGIALVLPHLLFRGSTPGVFGLRCHPHPCLSVAEESAERPGRRAHEPAYAGAGADHGCVSGLRPVEQSPGSARRRGRGARKARTLGHSFLARPGAHPCGVVGGRQKTGMADVESARLHYPCLSGCRGPRTAGSCW